MYYSKKEYLTKKMCLDDNDCKYGYRQRCPDPEETLCGPCWYQGVIIQPVENIPECKDCLKDTDTFRVELNKNKNQTIIEIEPTCCIWCIWFDWFHQKRLTRLAPNQTIRYIWKKDREKKN
jgi:hypothetical protein